jgi:hypothetical protein
MERERANGTEGKIYHETQLCPLVQKVAVDIDAVGLAEILRDQSADGRKILLLETLVILHIFQLRRQLCYPFLRCHVPALKLTPLLLSSFIVKECHVMVPEP